MSGRALGARERGTTLVELLVATLILMVALAIAHGLLVECLRIFAGSSRELRHPDRTLVVRQLRLDLTASDPVPRERFWNGEPLSLRGEQGWIRWRLDDERISRESFAPDGTSLGQRPMLDGVVAFQWRAPLAGLVEVEIQHRLPAGDLALRAGTAAWRRQAERIETVTLVAACRRGRLW